MEMETMAKTKLEKFIRNLEPLPAELRKNFETMEDLDKRIMDTMKTVDFLSNEFLYKSGGYSARKKSTKIAEIKKLYREVDEMSEEKIQMAARTYEMVDKHIRKLDTDFARFEADLNAYNSHMSDCDSSCKKKGQKSVEKSEKKKGRHSVPNEEEVAKSGRKKKNSIPTEIPALTTLSIAGPSDVTDMPVDPNEPTYCFCHQVSYGEMIGCDNPECSIEWFHFACVNLVSKPKGKWFCSQCLDSKKNQ